MGFRLGKVLLREPYQRLLRRDRILRSSEVGNLGVEKWYTDAMREIEKEENKLKAIVDMLLVFPKEYEEIRPVVSAFLGRPHLMPKPFLNATLRGALGEFCSKWMGIFRAIEDFLPRNPQGEEGEKILDLVGRAKRSLAAFCEGSLHAYLLEIALLMVSNVVEEREELEQYFSQIAAVHQKCEAPLGGICKEIEGLSSLLKTAESSQSRSVQKESQK